ncbi:Cytochrome c oxidase assembly factor 3, mitochondrial [Madurella mycetomatis]|uniref:Cytochrome c oxidase assembly factor 3 n=1 Tax=Madurella mycetomatis TaxID=100816 RepID=A0A175W1W6_9PEZI|nr:Cytochrome c oxidase assembly factor 3, mitochondrial [Madurella mycetomatis]
MAGFQPSTYYDRRHRQSPALIRARRPYLVKNAALGLALATISVGIYAYTINAIGQDEFEDVKVPDAPVRTPSAPTQNTKS